MAWVVTGVVPRVVTRVVPRVVTRVASARHVGELRVAAVYSNVTNVAFLGEHAVAVVSFVLDTDNKQVSIKSSGLI